MPGHIPPSTWGPFFWHTMHIVALGYSNQPTYAEKRAAKEFYESLTQLIPCPICRVHYSTHLKANPISPSLDSRNDLFRWTVNIHNLINKDLGKPEYTETESMNFYHSLGELGRSPVWTPQDIQSIQFKQALEFSGMMIGGGLMLGGMYYIFTKLYKL